MTDLVSEFPLIIPPLPFVGVISGGLQIGMVLEFICILHKGARINISFLSGLNSSQKSSPDARFDSVAFHISLRDDETAIVRNYLASGLNWDLETEERGGGYPITADKSFNLKILVQETHFEIFLDGEHFTDFNHRLPYKDNKYVHIDTFTEAGTRGTYAEVRYFEVKRPKIIDRQRSAEENLFNAIQEEKSTDKNGIDRDAAASLLLKILMRGIKSLTNEDKPINTSTP